MCVRMSVRVCVQQRKGRGKQSVLVFEEVVLREMFKSKLYLQLSTTAKTACVCVCVCVCVCARFSMTANTMCVCVCVCVRAYV